MCSKPISFTQIVLLIKMFIANDPIFIVLFCKAVVDDFRMRLQMPTLDVKYLNLSGDYSPDSDSNSKFVSLLRCCPKLCKLEICFRLREPDSPDCSESVSDLLEGHLNLHYRHNALQTLKLNLFSGS
ncbi:unnamed protein product [Cuscuta epithymum]|uniref:FBD domain-containing protein n=1 Tax=Cuscuta epithymum TaxID=186058 RepID=A0AAV0C8X8_9ASTE|nr:unnamed protein product [Cuscuta epithymum]CAH9138961.1 unnamed protein product [Cuscuta epithymum]